MNLTAKVKESGRGITRQIRFYNGNQDVTPSVFKDLNFKEEEYLQTRQAFGPEGETEITINPFDSGLLHFNLTRANALLTNFKKDEVFDLVKNAGHNITNIESVKRI